jgi:hypothetical protein
VEPTRSRGNQQRRATSAQPAWFPSTRETVTLDQMTGVLRQSLLVMVLATVAGCSHQPRTSVPTPTGAPIDPHPDCPGISPVGPQHETDQFLASPLPGDSGALTKSLSARLTATGALCPRVTLSPTETMPGGLPAPHGTLRLHMHWVGTPGEDSPARQSLGAFLLRSGDLAVRPVLTETLGPCAASSDLSGTAAAHVSSGARCLSLGAPLLRDPKVANASVAAGNAQTWTLHIRLDLSAIRTLAGQTGRPVFVSVDGFPLGQTVVPPQGVAFNTTGHFDGGETEATAVVANLQNPLGQLIGVAATA